MTDAQSFIDALKTLEEDGDVGPIAALFAPDADVENPLVEHKSEGPDGAREFWTSYRSAFETIASEFRQVIESDDVAALEWISTGALKAGGDFRYGGVSVLEFGEDGITAFRSYFDPGKLGQRLHAAG
jgi:ketosteroid isomerase-like protein